MSEIEGNGNGLHFRFATETLAAEPDRLPATPIGVNGTHNGRANWRQLRPVSPYRPLSEGRLRGLSEEAVSNGTLVVTCLWLLHRTARRFRRQLVNVRRDRTREALALMAAKGQDIAHLANRDCVCWQRDEESLCALCRAIELLTLIVSPADSPDMDVSAGEAADELRALLPFFDARDRIDRLKECHRSMQAEGNL